MRTRVASTALLAIGGLHVAWGLGASWPRIDREPAGPAACFAVAGLLGVAAGLVAGRPRRAPRLSRLGARTVTAVLATRGAFGMAGRTDLLASDASSEGFRSMDRRVYSPICLTLAALALPPP
ncbi:MAG TPA: DUF3995 domain-containing protein [Thermoleophilaceae bacterium]|nr:DUF3995 domain-containing protein [Thermoleophilaceae bacterium]